MAANNLATFAAWLFLVTAMWASFTWWAMNWYFQFDAWWIELKINIQDDTSSAIFGKNEWRMILWGLPPLAIAFFSLLYYSIPNKIQSSRWKICKLISSSFGTTLVFPWPFGIIKIGEMCGLIALTILFIVFYYNRMKGVFTKVNDRYSKGKLSYEEMWHSKLDGFAQNLGLTSGVVFAFLFFPVSRRSPIMRILGIPFELGIKYHIWMGHLSIFLSTLHGLLYYTLFIIEDNFVEMAFEWKKYSVPKLAGGILMIISLVMWVAALKPIRRKFFEVFFYTHQLYLLYILFLCYHYAVNIQLWAFAPLFLFFLDRLLRFYQSRYIVDVVSAKILPCGYIEMVLPKSKDLKVDCLGILFLNVPSVSKLQWHPFSISSNSPESHDHITIHVKPTSNVNSWTSKLASLISSGESAITAHVEGPYNSELCNFINYEGLIMVAGGAGITPFLSIIRQLTFMNDLQENSSGPSVVHLVWVVRDVNELELLNTIHLPTLKSINFHIHLYVTSEEKNMPDFNPSQDVPIKDKARETKPIVAPVGSHNSLVELFIFVITLFGTIFVMALFIRHVVYPNEQTIPRWVKGFVYLIAFLLGIFIFGTLSSLFEKLISKRSNKPLTMVEVFDSVAKEHNAQGGNLKDISSIAYGARPNFVELFEMICAKTPSDMEICVMGSGPNGMLRSVAWECQKRSIFSSTSPKLRFNPLSFTL